MPAPNRKQNSKRKPVAPATTSAKQHKVKIISITIIALFVIIIAAGLFREYHERLNHSATTPDEIASASHIVATAVTAQGDDLTAYAVTVSPTIRATTHNGKVTRTVDVCLSENETRQLFVVDLTTQSVVLHETVEYSGLDPLERHHYTEDLASCGNRDASRT